MRENKSSRQKNSERMCLWCHKKQKWCSRYSYQKKEKRLVGCVLSIGLGVFGVPGEADKFIVLQIIYRIYSRSTYNKHLRTLYAK